jgi:hypothetical protein
MRVTTSVAPPGANGTITLIGPDGKSDAFSARAAPTLIANAAASSSDLIGVILISEMVASFGFKQNRRVRL